ncbi:hypothetical protein BRAO375_1800005 [Bradyrhizobium sp. ORS 375]|nr:hypothetical protein BRAO375_1800005 [Bradyrhizobium sp. ORS 375]
MVDGWPDAYETVIAPLLQSSRAGRATRLTGFAVALRGPDGTMEERIFDTDWSPIRDEAGGVAGALQTLIEATERVRAQRALREKEERYRALFERAVDSIWLADQDGKFVAVNPAACQLLGYAAEEHLRLSMFDIIRAEDLPRLRELMKALAAGRHVTELWDIRRADGTYIPLELSHSVAPDGQWQTIGRDISERQRAETALRQSKELRRIALESGGMGAWRWDTRNRMVRSDAPFQRLWGMSLGDKPHSVSVYIDRMHPEGAVALEAVMARPIAPGEDMQDQVQVAHGPTAGRWIQWRGRAERDKPWIINGVQLRHHRAETCRAKIARQRGASGNGTEAHLLAARFGGSARDRGEWTGDL